MYPRVVALAYPLHCNPMQAEALPFGGAVPRAVGAGVGVDVGAGKRAGKGALSPRLALASRTNLDNINGLID